MCCFVLHNVAIACRDEIELVEEVNEDEEMEEDFEEGDAEGNAYREQFVQMYFT